MLPFRFRGPMALALLLALGGCSGEPDEAAMRQGLEALHREWAQQVRQATPPPPAPRREDDFVGRLRPDLHREAQLDLQITDIKKLGCQAAPDAKLGYVCTAEVRATVAGQKAIERRIKGRFVADSARWFVRDVQILDVN